MKSIRFTYISKILVLSLCTSFFTSCNTSGNTYFGIVELFNGRPVPPRTVPRNAIGPMPVGTLPAHTLQGIVVMDSGSDYDGINPLTYLSNMLESYHSEDTHKGDLPFHYFIDGNGNAYAGRNIISPGEIHWGDSFLIRSPKTEKKEVLMARLNRKNKPLHELDGFIIICVLGNYDEQNLTEKQEQMLYQTIAYLVFQHNIALERIYPLSTFIPESNNPGFYLKNYLQTSILQTNIPPPPGEHRFLVPEPRASVW